MKQRFEQLCIKLVARISYRTIKVLTSMSINRIKIFYCNKTTSVDRKNCFIQFRKKLFSLKTPTAIMIVRNVSKI